MQSLDTSRYDPSHMFFTTQEVADRYRVSVRTVEGWRQRCVGPKWIKLGGHIRYHLNELAKFEQITGF
jgi:hypothetical protein